MPIHVHRLIVALALALAPVVLQKVLALALALAPVLQKGPKCVHRILVERRVVWNPVVLGQALALAVAFALEGKALAPHFDVPRRSERTAGLALPTDGDCLHLLMAPLATGSAAGRAMPHAESPLSL